MIRLAIPLISVFFLINFCDVKEMYDMDVDDFFSSIIGPVYEVKKTTHAFKLDQLMDTTTMSTGKIKSRFLNEPDFSDNSTERNKYFATRRKRKIKGSPQSKTKAELDIDALLESPQEKPIPDFDVDPFKVLSRRFDVVRSQFTVYRAKQALRVEYFFSEYVDLIKMEKKRLFNVMEQFIYESRYKLVYAQKLRKKYRRRVAYQLGYCFAMIRTMKQHQNMLYSAMDINRQWFHNFGNFYYFIKIYERIIRLDIDLKDLIKFIKYLDFMVAHHNVIDRPGR